MLFGAGPVVAIDGAPRVSDIGGTAGVATARVRHASRISPIWIIPILAVAIAAWLAWDTLSKRGPTITISFETAEGLQVGQSQLKFKDLTLGTVKSLTLTSDHSHVIVTVGTTHEAANLLTDRTVFWVVKPRLFAGNLTGLDTLLSGSYIALLPSPTAGKAQREFVGLENPPVLESDIPGKTFLVRADRLGSISLGSPVFFRDLTVGEVLGWDLGEMAEYATLHVFVRSPFDKYVHDGSRFWNASGLSVKLGAGGVEVQMESMRALLLGGIAFETPAPATATQVSVADHTFKLFANRETADAASFTRRIPFVAYFDGSVSGLAPGADVTLLGLKIGEVTGVTLRFDEARDTVVAPVTFEVEPERFLGVGKRAYKDAATGVADLVARGLRASLQSGNLLTGQKLVAVDFVTDAPPATVSMQGGAFVMPTAPGGGLGGLQASATALLTKINQMPFAEIGKSLAATLDGLKDITDGPQIKQSLTALTATLTAAESTLRQVDAGVGPAMHRLPEIATSLEKTLTDANKLVLSMDSGYGDNTRFNRDLEHLLSQADDAVRSIRSLADLLSRHPEVLIRGRTNQGVE